MVFMGVVSQPLLSLTDPDLPLRKRWGTGWKKVIAALELANGARERGNHYFDLAMAKIVKKWQRDGSIRDVFGDGKVSTAESEHFAEIGL